jgi:hypothetical protein
MYRFYPKPTILKNIQSRVFIHLVSKQSRGSQPIIILKIIKSAMGSSTHFSKHTQCTKEGWTKPPISTSVHLWTPSIIRNFIQWLPIQSLNNPPYSISFIVPPHSILFIVPPYSISSGFPITGYLRARSAWLAETVAFLYRARPSEVATNREGVVLSWASQGEPLSLSTQTTTVHFSKCPLKVFLTSATWVLIK